MLRYYTLLFISCMLLADLAAQSTGLQVYDIMQTYCVSCHNADNPPAGLNLVGNGTTDGQRWLSVQQKIVHDGVETGDANASGGPIVYPGRPDQSFLFRKINKGLDAHASLLLQTDEGGSMPPYGQPTPTASEIELIRQWILFGAQINDSAVDVAAVNDYYENGGLAAFPDGAPAAPADTEGFQIKMGPFYLSPGDEEEYFQRYELDLPEDIEVNRITVEMGTYSHHFIIYDWENGGDNQVPHGLRPYAFHNNINLVAAVQGSEDLQLPAGTAFRWEEGLVLDLNTHYINYSATMPYQAEVYINIYTQPNGTAAQEMHSDLIVKGNIPIPNNGDETTHQQHVNYNLGDQYVWALMGHTHKYGTGYKVWTREGGQAQELIYDGACPQGIPGCATPSFDYQHIPIRKFDPLYPIRFDFSHGIVHEAKWINDGPVPVNFGPTSDDEMMVLAIMYTTDSTGVQVTSVDEAQAALARISVYPTPAVDHVRLLLPPDLGEVTLRIYDAVGQLVRAPLVTGETVIHIDRQDLPQGIYYYEIAHTSGARQNGKLLFQ